MKPLPLVLLLLPLTVTCLEPFSAGLAVGGGMVLSALWSSREVVVCQFRECCGAPWVRPNVSRLEESLADNVFGQHLVTSLVTRSIRAHLRKLEPKKALVMSFHGWTGAGKNFVAKFVAESLYKEGMASKYVHLFISTLHFPHMEMADIYKLRVQDWIRGNVTQCETSIFIFDEIDKMPEGMIDGIKPFIDHHQNVEGLNFRKSIFIFLSNTGGRDITKETVRFWSEGRQREDISYKDLEMLVNKGAFNELGGLHRSAVIDSSLIDVYVPFLPLERKHVKMCVEKEARTRNITMKDEDMMAVVDSLSFWPKDTQLYSTTGCKRVANKLDLYQEEMEEEVL
eukprot:GFUD01030436.1.p1 GENE.GFUD01030436.1~~GFUD01030436.1.p1  ORF type:complete len:340 (-),score=109.62 GFUD01030436.1:69-1088(-)